MAVALFTVGVVSLLVLSERLRARSSSMLEERIELAAREVRIQLDRQASLAQQELAAVMGSPVFRAVLGIEGLDAETLESSAHELMSGYEAAFYRIETATLTVFRDADDNNEKIAAALAPWDGLRPFIFETSGAPLVAVTATTEIGSGRTVRATLGKRLVDAKGAVSKPWTLSTDSANTAVPACRGVPEPTSVWSLPGEVSCRLSIDSVTLPPQASILIFVDNHRNVSELRAIAIIVLLALGGGGLVVVSLTWWLIPLWARPVTDASAGLNNAARLLLASSQAQEAATMEESETVRETRRLMSEVASSASFIADRSHAVVQDAEKTAHGNRNIDTHIQALEDVTARIGELLSSIRTIAERADILALNAGLQGIRAGEAGKGFTMVASEIRKLADFVGTSVDDVRKLMGQVQEAMESAAHASRNGIERSEQTTRSARSIAEFAEKQADSSKTVDQGMNELEELLEGTSTRSREMSECAQRLRGLADTIGRVMR